MSVLIPLGTNGFFPSHGRATMSFLVVSGQRALLLDAGSGVARLGEPFVAARLAEVQNLDIVLSHYHLDHVIGLAFLPGVWRGRRARIFAPGPPLVEGTSATAFEHLLTPPLFSHPPREWPVELEIHDYRAAADLGASGWPLTLRAQQHPGGSVGLRLGDQLAYVTDTICDPATVGFVRGVGLLLHEVWWTDSELAAAPHAAGHSSVGAVATLAREASVGALAPIHHRPDRDPAALAALVVDLREAAKPLPVVELEEGRAVALE